MKTLRSGKTLEHLVCRKGIARRSLQVLHRENLIKIYLKTLAEVRVHNKYKKILKSTKQQRLKRPQTAEQTTQGHE
jgi:hypothetical protein